MTPPPPRYEKLPILERRKTKDDVPPSPRSEILIPKVLFLFKFAVEVLGKQNAMTGLHVTKQNVMTGFLLSDPQRLHWTKCAWSGRERKHEGCLLSCRSKFHSPVYW